MTRTFDLAQLLGSWRLVSVTSTTASGENIEAPFGERPTGLLTYTAGGQMFVIISYDGRPPLSSPDRVAAPAAERAEAFTTSFSYAGRYSLDGDRVLHHVEVSTVENWVNVDLVRFARFDAGRLILQTPPQLAGEVRQTYELVWERFHQG